MADGKNFEKARKEIESFWLKNQHPDCWKSWIIKDAIQTIISKSQLKSGGKKVQQPSAKNVNPFFSAVSRSYQPAIEAKIGKKVRNNNHFHRAKTTNMPTVLEI